jgi:hypothetical protein
MPERGVSRAPNPAARPTDGGGAMSSVDNDSVDTVDNDSVDTVETYNPWTVVNLVFNHLAGEGLHPILGSSGDPGAAARDLLLALGIAPAAEGNRKIMQDVHEHLAEIRVAVFDNE